MAQKTLAKLVGEIVAAYDAFTADRGRFQGHTGP